MAQALMAERLLMMLGGGNWGFLHGLPLVPVQYLGTYAATLDVQATLTGTREAQGRGLLGLGLRSSIERALDSERFSWRIGPKKGGNSYA